MTDTQLAKNLTVGCLYGGITVDRKFAQTLLSSIVLSPRKGDGYVKWGRIIVMFIRNVVVIVTLDGEVIYSITG